MVAADHFEMRVRERTHHVHKADEARARSIFILLCRLDCVCRTQQIDANREHRPPSRSVCKSRAKNAQHFDSSTSRAYRFNASRTRYKCELLRLLHTARTGNEKSSKNSLQKVFSKRHFLVG